MGNVNQWLIDQGEHPEVDWTRLPAQKDFITSQYPFTMFSGGFGTGKTSALNGRIIGLMTLIPGNLGYLARQDGKALKQTTMIDLLARVDPEYQERVRNNIILAGGNAGRTVENLQGHSWFLKT